MGTHVPGVEITLSWEQVRLCQEIIKTFDLKLKSFKLDFLLPPPFA